MLTTTIFPGRYIQGPGALHQLGSEMARFGQKGFLICDPVILPLPGFPEVQTQIEPFRGECSDEEIQRLAALAQAPDVMVGIGGGKTLDTAKAAAHTLGLPVIVAPTIASTDAPCSALSVIYTPSGDFKRYLFYPANPNVVLVDTQIIARAPVRLLVAGMGDALATWFEADSCRRSQAPNMSGRLGSMTAHALARLCYDTLLADGAAAKAACEAQRVTPELERVIEANTLLSGLGFESGGLAAAHAIHNGLTVLAPTHRYYHGEKVTIGLLASLYLTGKPPEIIEEVYGFCRAVGLPTTLADIGLAEATREDLQRVAEKACAPGETIHNEPLAVTPELLLSALEKTRGQATCSPAGLASV